MRNKAFFRRNAFHSVAVVAALLPAVGVLCRDAFQPRPELVSAFATPVSDLSAVFTPAPSSVGGAVEDAVAEALGALSSSVSRSSHPEALRSAFQAYFSYKAARPGTVRKPYLYFVDMGLDNRTPRGYVFDMEKLSVVDGPFTVAHGNGSSSGRDGVPDQFSNRSGSHATSLGLYLAQETYGFSGKAGGRVYSSVGLRLQGESPGFNDAARERGIVAHGAPYVTAGRAGRSEGCPAMEPERAARLLPMLANGGVVFVYSPNDPRWLGADPWLQGALAE